MNLYHESFCVKLQINTDINYCYRIVTELIYNKIKKHE